MAQAIDVIIIGAGMAGLAAARGLVEAGFQVLALEARSRLGGRVWTDRDWPGIPLDMGASWIHGIEANPIAALAGRLGVETAATDYNAIAIYDSHGRPLTEMERIELKTALAELISQTERLAETLAADISLSEGIEQVLANWDLPPDRQQRLDYALNTTIEHEYAANLGEMSLLHWADGFRFDGPDVLFPDGYDRLVAGLAAGLEIKQEHIVSGIIYGDAGVTVNTNRGVFTARRAVVTLPLGVLKARTVRFSPPLPGRKQAAINRLGVGVLNKLYLRYPEVFWDAAAHMLGYIPRRKGEWAEFLNIYKYTGQPVLLAFNAGTYGEAIEQWPDEQIVAAATGVLRTIFGSDIPAPTAWRISRWRTDPFAGGSYSYTRAGASPEDYDALAAPVAERLFFAGEATSRAHSATVHGAYLSGQRAAAEIIELDAGPK